MTPFQVAMKMTMEEDVHIKAFVNRRYGRSPPMADMLTPKITREMIERYFAAKEGRAPNPFPTLPGMDVTPRYVVHEHDLDALCALALQAESMQREGWVMVPKKLAPEMMVAMLDTGFFDNDLPNESDLHDLYAAMLTSLPEPRT